MFSLNCAWTNGWVNIRDLGDFGRLLWRHCNVIALILIMTNQSGQDVTHTSSVQLSLRVQNRGLVWTLNEMINYLNYFRAWNAPFQLSIPASKESLKERVILYQYFHSNIPTVWKIYNQMIRAIGRCFRASVINWQQVNNMLSYECHVTYDVCICSIACCWIWERTFSKPVTTPPQM